MKIFLSGAQGTGKSTIINKIDLNLKKYDSFSKIFLNKNKNIQLVNNSNFFEFQHRIFLYCSNIYLNDDNFISSRGLADSYAYIKYALKFYDYRGFKELLNLIEVYMDILNKENVYFFYTPIEFKLSLEGNKNRIIDRKYQLEIDNYIKEFLENYNYYTLNGTIDERIKKIKEIVNEN